MSASPRYLLLSVLVFPVAADAGIDFTLFHKLAPSVVKIEAHGNGKTAVGSGVMVAPEAIVTNCHVTRDAQRIDIVKAGATYQVRAQKSDLKHDVCVLLVPTANLPVVEISRAKPRVGQQVIAMGYEGGLGPRFTGGEVKALYDFDGGAVIQSTASFQSGASGGGLFDGDGKLIGLISFKNRQRASYHFSLPVDWIYQSLDNGAAREIAPLPAGTPFWQQSPPEQPYFLRAAALESEEKWHELLRLTKDWTTSEKSNANAWLMLGHAYFNLHQDNSAIDAYHQAVDLSREYPEAWYALGASYLRNGQKNKAQEAYGILAGLDQNLAEQFSRNFLQQ
ncbi:MAG: trypsin-like peptidase domain-containing protein [Burkholderiales bacterium]